MEVKIMNNEKFLVAEIKGLLMALESATFNVRFQLAPDNVHDTHLLEPVRQYLDAVAAKMKTSDEPKMKTNCFKNRAQA